MFLGHSVFLILQPPCGCSTASVLYHEVNFGLKSLIVPVARLIPCLDLGPLVKNHHDCLKKKNQSGLFGILRNIMDNNLTLYLVKFIEFVYFTEGRIKKRAHQI